MIRLLRKHKDLVAWLIAFALMISFIYAYNPGRKTVLKLGVYAGSSWDVPSNDTKVLDRVIKKFEKAYPNVKVEYESGIQKSEYSQYLAEKIVQGKQPDVFVVPQDDFALLADNGALQDISSYMENQRLSKTDFYEAAYNTGVYHNALYGLPLESNPMMMCVNIDLLKKEGIQLPASLDLNQFYAICKKVTHDGQYGVAGMSWQNIGDSFGLKVFTDDGKEAHINDETFKKTINFYIKLRNLNKDYVVSSEQFDEGKVAFMHMTLAQYRTYKPYPYRVAKYSTFNWDCITMPTMLEKPQTRLNTVLLSLSSRCTNKQMGFAFMKMLCYDTTIQQEWLKSNLGASPLQSVMNSRKSEKLFGETEALKSSTIDSIMQTSYAYPLFKKKAQAEMKLDYLINQAIYNNNNNVDYAYIQQEVDQEL